MVLTTDATDATDSGSTWRIPCRIGEIQAKIKANFATTARPYSLRFPRRNYATYFKGKRASKTLRFTALGGARFKEL